MEKKGKYVKPVFAKALTWLQRHTDKNSIITDVVSQRENNGEVFIDATNGFVVAAIRGDLSVIEENCNCVLIINQVAGLVGYIDLNRLKFANTSLAVTETKGYTEQLSMSINPVYLKNLIKPITSDEMTITIHKKDSGETALEISGRIEDGYDSVSVYGLAAGMRPSMKEWNPYV